MSMQRTYSLIASLFIACVILYAPSSQAQLADVSRINAIATSRPFGSQPATSSRALLDFSRVRFQHSYSMSYLSNSFGSASLGMLNTTMFYDLAPNMSLAIGLSVAHDPLSLLNREKQSFDARILPSFRLDYQPSKNVFMSLSYERRESLFNPYTFDNHSLFQRGIFGY